MKKLFTILLITGVSQFLFAQESGDTLNGCNARFTWKYTDSLLYGPSGNGLMLFSECTDPSLQHKWILSNGLETDEMNPFFIIAPADSLLEICHKIIDNTGILCEHCEMVYIPPANQPKCFADFSFYTDLTVNCNCLQAYRFVDQSSEETINWKWSFGDGDTSDIQNPVHYYSDPGFYHIVLETRTSDGCSATMVKHIFLRDSDECDLKIEYEVLESFPPRYQFYSNLYDPRLPYSHIPPSDDSTWFGIIRYSWDFGDGSYSADVFPQHVFSHSGEYTVKLEITYDDGFKCSAELREYFTGSDHTGYCNLTGTVWDYTGLDGCGYLIELDNGTRLEPILRDTMFYFHNNQRVRLSYIERPDLISICMAGIIAEITCIEEIESDTIFPPPYCEEIMLNTSFSINGGFCNGTASIEIITRCNAWMYYEMIMNTDYQILWSTGETTKSITGLCPGNLYFVNVTNPVTGNTHTAAFSIFRLNNVFPAWTFTRSENTYWFSLPVDDTYTVTWNFDNGISMVGKDVSYTFNSGGNHEVVLVVKDQAGTEVYSEIIQLSIPETILFYSTESLTIFPNPADNNLSVSMAGYYDKTVSMNVYNFSGQLLIEKYFTNIAAGNTINLDLSGLKPGIYLLVIIDGNGSSHSIKFEKN
jgi:PKD repeat protein